MLNIKIQEKDYRLYDKYDKKLTSEAEKYLQKNGIEPSFSENAISILKKRYLKKDKNGVPLEDVKGLIARVAANIAYPDFFYNQNKGESIAKKIYFETAEKFYEIMVKQLFIPNSPTLMNAGREMQQLSACFVLPIKDSMNSIFGSVRDAALVHKTGGGTGFSFGNLRRKNDYVSSTYGKASGPVSFLKAYNEVTNSVNQGGFRRGANMGVMPIYHPDILEFIYAKEKEGELSSFNLSVALDNEFMEALKNNSYFYLKNPRKGKLYYLTLDDLKAEEKSVSEGLISPLERNLIIKDEEVYFQHILEKDLRGNPTKTELIKVGKMDKNKRIMLHAPTIFELISYMAWKNGEPGVIFIDEINKHNPTHPKYFNKRGKLPLGVGIIESTNPCGEQPLLSYEACNLGSINLGKFVIRNKENSYVNKKALEEIVKESVHFLDNVIDMSKFPLPQITKIVHRNRKIGLGVMGLADMLVQLSLPYNSEEGRKATEEVMKFISDVGGEKSEEMALERGAFPNYPYSKFANGKPRRNATITTIAPTGTISIIAEASSGIEPYFDLWFTHTDADGQKREFINKFLFDDLKEYGIDEKKVIEELKKGKSLQQLDYIPEKIKKVYVTTKDISVEDHIKMQACVQKYVDNAVSKTINMPNSATIEDVKNSYLLAYKLGCKGVTIYRDGSRQVQVLESKIKTKGELKRGEIEKVPPVLPAIRIRQRTPFGNMHVSITYDPKTQKIKEVFTLLGKSGDVAAADLEAIGRLSSLVLRLGGKLEDIIEQLEGIGSNISLPTREGKISSLSDGLAKALKKASFIIDKNLINEINSGKIDLEKVIEKYYENNGKENFSPPDNINNNNFYVPVCPECGGKLMLVEGCKTCQSCGWSQC